MKEGKNKVTDEDASMTVGKASQQHIEGVQNGVKALLSGIAEDGSHVPSRSLLPHICFPTYGYDFS